MTDPPFCEGDGLPYSAEAGDFVDVEEEERWECIMCGNCCGNIFTQTWLDASLREYIGEPVDRYCRHFDRNGHLCHVHPGRPNICRGYPFILGRKGDHYKLKVHGKCSGLGRGPVVNVREKLLEVVKLIEDEFDVDFLIDWGESNGKRIKVYRVK